MAGEKIKAVANGGMTEFQGYKDYLDNENGKILIFVINYFGDNRIKCLDQDQHLQEILALLKKFNILRRTEAVYLILTKADLFPDQNKQKYCDEYLNQYYNNDANFFKGLDQILIKVLPPFLTQNLGR